MDRKSIVESLKDNTRWDIIIIGGGATGLGTALDASSRGYKTLLLEMHDFAKGTSSRSTKLVHGGVRYLKQGNISLVLEALKERGLLLQNAPHVVKKQSFIIPGYRWWDKPFYGIGLKLYDKLAGDLVFGPSETLTVQQTLDELPSLEPKKLSGGIKYFDGQFDDSRLAVNLMQSIYDHSGVALNYMTVTGLLKQNGRVSGVVAQDQETGTGYEIRAKSVVNATGVFTDTIRKLDNPDTPPIIKLSQGVHIVLDRKFQPGNSALMIPKTDDGRVLFAVPWHDKVIVGTTDTPVQKAYFEPRALESELEFLLSHTARYLTLDPGPSDVRSVFTGLRPLVQAAGDKKTKKISRDHTILTDPSGLITVTGGKWTTYRKMAEDTVNIAAETGNLEKRNVQTENLKIHGWLESPDSSQKYHLYGSDSDSVKRIEGEQKTWGKPIHPDLPYTPAEVIWSVRHEMARTVEDVLCRRTRALFLDARASMDMAPVVAGLISKERNLDESWEKLQTDQFLNLARDYLIVNQP